MRTIILLACLCSVALANRMSSGTGVIINQSYVVTAYHVIDEFLYACLYNADNNICYGLEIVATDPDADVAILHFSTGHLPDNYGSCAVATTEADIGSPVVSYGFYNPINRNVFTMSHYNSYVKDLDNIEGDDRMYRISVELLSGFSGGPSFDSEGRVIGIARSVSNVEEDVSNIVKSSVFLKMLEDNDIGLYSTTKNPKKCTAIIINSKYLFNAL